MRYLSWIITLPIALVVILFSVSNREPVTLGIWPLPFTVGVPLFLVVLAVLVLGIFVGGTVAWLSGRRYRRLARRQRGRLAALTAEVELLRTSQAAADEADARRTDAERLTVAARAADTVARRETAEGGRQLTAFDRR
ncbi:MAG: lipopolysaccharide assembly protein LapA domain-containing protein [Alphaproteobacteria bacterium]